MSWKDTHEARIAAHVTEVRGELALINATMLGIPPRFKFKITNDGHKVELVEEKDTDDAG